MRWPLCLLVVASGCDDGAIHVPAGAFVMGCNADVDTRCEADEFPAHEVRLAAFVIDRDEVSQARYSACVEADACTLPSGDFDPNTTPDLAVTFVTWEQADTFCAWEGKRLPTEAEWELAARGDDGRIYPWGNQPPDCSLANVFGCGDAVLPVGGRPAGASPFGVLDMAGNVMEWVADWYDESYYAASPSVDPMGPDSGAYRVKRGGSYMGDVDTVRVSNRVTGFPLPLPNLGFRCARDD